MADFGVNINMQFNPRDVMMRSEAACDRARFDTAVQVLKDSNFYCKERSGTLKKSALINSIPEQGLIQWVTPYASYQYDYPFAYTVKNPHAMPKWFNVAQAYRQNNWFATYRNSYNRVFGGGSP